MTQGHFEIDRPGALNAGRVSRLANGYVSAVRVIEGAYFTLLPSLEDGGGAMVIESTSEEAVPGVNDGPGAMRWGIDPLSAPRLTLFARRMGQTTLRFAEPRVDNIDSQILVTVEERLGRDENHPSLASLSGPTFALNAPDTPCYVGDQTKTCASTTTAALVFNGVPVGTRHLLLAGHQVEQYAGLGVGDDHMAMGLGGKKAGNFQLNQTNVVAAFERLKGRITTGGVIWIGGCALGAAKAMCLAAAAASGCVVVAPTMSVLNRKFPLNRVDLIGGPYKSAVFLPDGKTMINSYDFAAGQNSYGFHLSPNK